jgi:aryl-phospho-beta-D-glucosidase BglC (GH1 family)
MGIIFDKYRAGINLGGWISQSRYEKEHIASFIKKEDVEKIASWGLDHIRLPFDYPILEDDNNPFSYKEEGFGIIDKLLGWCKEASLNLVLDMHKAPGYAFYNKSQDQILFTDENTQKRYVSLWQAIAKRYKNEKDNVVFELLNEIVDANGDAWNKIARKAIEGIKDIDPDRYILLGGPHYNSADGLNSLEVWEDKHVLYNFHFYEPFLFTHQRAVWTPLKDFDVNQPYPGKIEGIAKVKMFWNNQMPEQGKSFTADTVFNKAFLEDKLAPAIAFSKRTNKELYCGEYGAIDLADLDSRINYLSDMKELFDKYRIGRACWSYKGMNFTSIDEKGNPVSDKLIKALSLK